MIIINLIIWIMAEIILSEGKKIIMEKNIKKIKIKEIIIIIWIIIIMPLEIKIII